MSDSVNITFEIDDSGYQQDEIHVPPHEEEQAPEERHEYQAPEEQHEYQAPEEQHECQAPEEQHEYQAPEEQHEYQAPEEQHEYQAPEEQHEYQAPEEQHEYQAPEEQHEYQAPCEEPNSAPKIIFIVPYRDRSEQQRFFSFQMEKIMEDYKKTDYKIIYAHQKDTREFNRGAMKNIGFLYAKSLYPNDYLNITFVFNDVDTMPYNKNFLNYETENGRIKHFYGYYFTLGGIVSITGADFEKINGYPNYWAWGYEDNALNNRVALEGLTIDRSEFYPILDKNILQLKDGITRIVNRGEFDRYVDEVKYKNNVDGINTISNIVHTFDENTSFLNITEFKTPILENPELTKTHDLKNGNMPFLVKKPFKRGSMKMVME